MHARDDAERQLAVITRGAEVVLPREELATKLERAVRCQRPLRVKLGIDPSAPHLTLGHAVVLRKLRTFQDLGHTAVLVVGDFTRRIGDPSGKSKTREPMTPEDIQRNMATYREQAFRILVPEQTEVRFNSEWLDKLSFADVIALSARYTVARMLERDDFQRRYAAGVPITVMEFLYPLAQAYDSVAVHADVELGGSDQRFNLLIARDIQSAYAQEPQAIVTMPLLVGTDGVAAMSQSRGNYIGVDDAPHEQFGKVMSLPDEAMPQYYELLTDLAVDEATRAHPKEAKKRLAWTLVSTFHGPEAADRAREHFERVFEAQQPPDEMAEFRVPPEMIGDEGVPILNLIAAAELAPSRSQARRLVEQGAVQIDGAKITAPTTSVHVRTGMILRVGRLRFTRLVVD